MKKREIIFTIIKKLEKAEKRLINLELSKFKPSSTFVSIYTYFEKCTKFDEEDFKDFCRRNKIVNTNVHLGHLYKKILQLLIQYKDTLAVDDIDIKIQAQIKEANILREYGFLKEAAKKYKTALKLSAENSRYILMPEPLYELLQTAVLVKDASIIENGILKAVESDSFLDQMNWITNKITNTYSNLIVFMELLVLEYVEVPSDKRDKKVEKILEYVPKKYESTDLHEFISYYSVKMSQAFSSNDMKSYTGLIEKYLEEVKYFFKPGIQVALQTYAARLYSLYGKLFYTKPEIFESKHKTFFSHIEELSDQYEMIQSSQILLANKSRQVRLEQLGLFFKQNLTTAAIKTYLPNETQLKVLSSSNPYKMELAIASLQFIIIKNYKRSDECYTNLQATVKKTRSDKILYAEVDMMELIKAFEMNNEKYLTAFIKTIKGKHSRSFYVSQINKLLLALIVKLSNLAVEQHKKLMESYLIEILQLEKTIVHKYVPFSFWLKRRIKEADVKG